jgi:hypothetical protein
MLCKMLDSIGNSSLVMAGEQQDPSVHVPGAISCRVVLYLFWCSSVTTVTDTSCSLPLAFPDSTSAGLPLCLPSCVRLFVCVFELCTGCSRCNFLSRCSVFILMFFSYYCDGYQLFSAVGLPGRCISRSAALFTFMCSFVCVCVRTLY